MTYCKSHHNLQWVIFHCNKKWRFCQLSHHNLHSVSHFSNDLHSVSHFSNELLQNIENKSIFDSLDSLNSSVPHSSIRCCTGLPASQVHGCNALRTGWWTSRSRATPNPTIFFQQILTFLFLKKKSMLQKRLDRLRTWWWGNTHKKLFQKPPDHDEPDASLIRCRRHFQKKKYLFSTVGSACSSIVQTKWPLSAWSHLAILETFCSFECQSRKAHK